MKKTISLLLAGLMMISAVFSLTACSGKTNDKESGGSDVIRYIIYSSGGTLDDSDRIEAAVNKIVQEELGFSVDMEFLGYNDYANKLGLYMGSNENFDMCYTGSILTGLTYADRASKGYFMDITEMLPEYAPELYESMSSEVWDAARIDGKIYGVINEQIFARSVGLCIDTEVADAIGLTQEKIDSECLTYRECINMAMEYIAGNESISPNGKVPSTTLVIGDAWSDIYMQNFALDSMGSDALVPGIIEAGKDSTTVINQYESEYFKEFAEFCVEMHSKGYISKEQANNPITANQRVRITGTYKPGVESELYNSIGRKFTQFRLGTPLLTTSNMTTSMTAIYTGSKNADKCLQFMNLMYTNKDLYNLVALGEEDLDYKWKQEVDDNGEVYDYISYVKSSKYKLNTDWSVGTEFNVYRKYLQSATVVEDTKKLNNESKKSPAYGFTYIPEKDLNSSLSACYTDANNYVKQFLNGTYDASKTVDEILGELNEKLNDNGAKNIVKSKQKQLDSFLSE